MPDQEMVDHPVHYGGDTVYEVIKVIEAWQLGFHLGNAVKYIARAGRKEGLTVDDPYLEDLKKARWYLDREIQRMSPKPPLDATMQQVTANMQTAYQS